jgi:hypothetical protein
MSDTNPYREPNPSPAQSQAEIEALLAELAAARSAREDAEARREAKKTPDQIRDDIERERRKAMEIDKLADLEAQHGPVDKAIRPIETLHGMVVVKRPAEMAYRKFSDMEKVTTSAARELAQSCLVYPDKEQWNRIVADEPAVIVRAANAACWLAGNRKELDEKK